MPSRAAATVLAALVLATGCGDGSDPVARQRADQLRSAALDAGLDPEVADLLALVGRATGETFQVTYAGDLGTALVVAQRPPHRRVDVVEDGRVVEVRLARGSVSYRCEPDPDELRCARVGGALRPPGTLTDEALDGLVDALVDARRHYELRVEQRTVAGATARCLVAALRPGAEAPERGALGTLCVSSEGAQLLVDTAGERLEAVDYSTEVPPGAFEPDDPEALG